METLLNLAWLGVCCLLVGLWAHAHGRAGVRSGRAESEALPGIPTQIVALLLLMVLLFPVISLTDDLAMCAATAVETEHALRSQKLDDVDHHAPPSALSLLASLAWLREPLAPLPLIDRTDRWIASVHPSTGVHLSVENRPPPSLL